MSWIDGSQAEFRGLTLQGNERQAFLIDGEVGAGSVISGVRFEGGGAVVQQRIDDGSLRPVVEGSALEIATEALPIAPPPQPYAR